MSESLPLAQLLDLASQRLDLNLEFDRELIRGEVTLRLGAGVTDGELWSLTNRLLAARGFTTVQMAGEGNLSVVKLGDAAALARLERRGEESSHAGYARALRPVLYADPASLVETLAVLSSKPGGSVSQLGKEAWLVISDLRPRVQQMLRVLETLDHVQGESVLEEVEVRSVPATEIVPLVQRVVEARAALGHATPAGRLLASSDERRVLIIAPESHQAGWQGLIDRFDRADARNTVTYVPRHHRPSDIVPLLEATLRGAAGATPWMVVPEDLTGTVAITATPSQHARLKELFERLEEAGSSERREFRTFSLRNRAVDEVLELLLGLLEAGALGESEGTGGSTPSELSRGPAVVPSVLRAEETTARASTREGSSRGAASVAGLSLTADEGTNSLIAVGPPPMLEQLDELIEALDVRQAQVMLEAFVISISESDAQDLGVELQRFGLSGDTVSSLSSLFGLGSPNLQNGESTAPRGSGFSGVLLDQSEYSAVLRAFESLNQGRSLAIPRILVDNHQQARLDSVLQAPFTSTNASDTVATTSFGGTQDAGTLITVRPQIAEGDHLLLDFEITQSQFVGDSVDPSLPPPRQQIQVQSVVTIPDGFTVVVGGLNLRSETEAVSQIPWLGDIPWLGRLFQSRSKSVTESQLFVFLRANIERNGDFAFLKHLSRRAQTDAEFDSGQPESLPRLIR